jgi:SAM-dependent methyltransferase
MVAICPDDPDLVDAFDELPLWSSPFGLELLDAVRMRRGMRVLDVGCGTGFPALELAGRLGATGRVVGIDPWRAALARARAKATCHGLTNVELVCGTAEALPFDDASFDAVVSNNGLNNVADIGRALAECHRVLAPGGQLVATMNLPETMRELYGPFAGILREREGEPGVLRLRDHIAARRAPVAETTIRLQAAGFTVDRVSERSFTLRFVDGTALFEYPFVRLAFLEPWRAVPQPQHVDSVMAELRDRLDRAAGHAGLDLTIPFACFDARRP